MHKDLKITVLIPALNEEQGIAAVLADLPQCVDHVIVVDNGSTDSTAAVARSAGAHVVHEPRRGYGRACLTGLEHIGKNDANGVVVFLDADHSDDSHQLERLIEPIARGRADLVIGSRTLGCRERGSLSPQQRFGNALACRLMRRRFGAAFTDLGPFRAIRTSALQHLEMDDPAFGWTIQMQIRAKVRGLRIEEVPVDYRRRIGTSKISGTLSGCMRAGRGIIATVFREPKHPPAPDDDTTPARERLIIFARVPIAGKAKTRLIPALGPDGAAALYREMMLRTLAVADELARSRGVEVEIHFTGGEEREMAAILGAARRYLPQAEGDLGTKMRTASEATIAEGVRSVVIIGTDCPQMDTLTINAAFEKLRAVDVVAGPASDGGYYLIGLSGAAPAAARAGIFANVAWSTVDVLRQTRRNATKHRLRLALLHMLNDVDEPEDIPVWREAQRQDPVGLRLSVVIPALNEEHQIAGAIASTIEGCASRDIEVIVADGGSTDATRRIAAEHNARIVNAPPGRACQMNAGASAATGDLLLFLHADTRLPPGFDRRIRTILSDPTVAVGAFRFATDDSRWRMRLIAAGTNLRTRLLSLPYGDQGFFMRRQIFDDLGGFADMPVMEDFEFIGRVRSGSSNACRIVIADAAVHTSARRWQRTGCFRTTLLNQCFIAAYHLGVPPERIAAWRRAGTPKAASRRRPDESHRGTDHESTNAQPSTPL